MSEAGMREALKKALIALQQTQDDLARLRDRQHEPIAIVGMGCRFPGGASDPERLWELLGRGEITARPVPESRWAAEAFYSADPAEPGKTHALRANFLDEPLDAFDAPFFNLSAKECEALDPQQRLLLEVSWEALEDAAQDVARLSGTRTGVYVGVSCDDYAQAHRYSGELTRIDGYSLTGTLLSTAAGRLAYTFGFEGPCIALDTACSSSLVAVHLAMAALRSGQAELALAGGVNLTLTPPNFVCSTKIGSISADGRCKTFDASADGYGRGEGCGVLVLERLSDALASGRRIHAVLRGSAINQDGRSNGMTAPNGKAQEKVLRAALADARLLPADVSYIEAHGTGTPLGDPIELEAIGRVMNGCRREVGDVLIGTLKSNIGHTESASGVAGLIKVALALSHGELPAHVGMQTPSPEIRWQDLPLEVVTERRDWRRSDVPRRAGVSSFGFSGTNAHVIVEEAPVPEARSLAPAAPAELLPLSALNASALGELAARYARHLRERPAELSSICQTAAAGRTHFGCRLAVLGSSAPELAQRLEGFTAAASGEGSYYGAPDQPRPRVAFLFTGQGSQAVGMGRALLEREPVFRDAFRACDALLSEALGRSLHDVIYGAEADAATLRNTRYAQPALFALGYALCQLYRSWGVEPELVVGHSVGEYAAACAAGILELPDAARLVSERARLLSSLPAGGSMAAVLADAADVQQTLDSLGVAVSLAALNAPGSCVISGASAELLAVAGELEKRGVVTRPLSVSHAFHSALMEPILEEFRGIAASVRYAPPRLSCLSTVAGANGGERDFRSAEYWTDNIRKPVDFLAATRALERAGANVFVEIGATPTLIGFARRTLSGRGLFVSTLDARRDDPTAVPRGLAQLYARGVPLDFGALRAARPAAWADNPHYPFQRRPYWKQPVVQLRSSDAGPELAPQHALLGRRLQSPALGDAQVFEAVYRAESPRFLRDHVIFERIISPAAAHLSLALLAARQLLGSAPLLDGSVACLHDMEFLAPLVVAESGARQVQLILQGPPGEPRSVRLLSRALGADAPWELHCTGSASVEPADSNPTSNGSPAWRAFEAACPERVEPRSVYARLEASGYHVGPSFRGLEAIRRGDGEALCWLRLPPEGQRDAVDGLHPGIIDALFQGAMAAAEPAVQQLLTGGHVLIPIQVGRVRQHRALLGGLVCHVRARAQAELVRCEFEVWNEDAELALEMDGFVLKRTTEDTLYRALAGDAAASRSTPRPSRAPRASGNPAAADPRPQQLAFATEWRSIEPASLRTALASALGAGHSYLLLSDSGALGDALMAHLEQHHVPCTRVVRTRQAAPLIADAGPGAPRSARIHPERPEHWQALLRSELARADNRTLNVLNLWAFDLVPWLEPSAAELGAACETLCAHSLSLAQALLSDEFTARVTLLTASAHAWPTSSDDRSTSPASAALWGLARSLRLEHPELASILVDVEPETRSASLGNLLATVARPAGERDFALRRGGRLFVPRLVELPLAPPAALAPSATPPAPDDASRFLQLPPTRVLDDLHLESRPRQLPGPHQIEVEVESAGLNFRDVLNALGQYPGPAGALGFECAGRVTRAGDAVTHLSPGDPVIVLAAPGCMADYITVDAALVAPAPRHLRAEDLVTLPATFLTALYALQELGQMRAGQRVLIHAAAGGVGLAAVQLASRAGLEVFATAGSPEKRRLLQAMGVPHVYDSRSLSFADAILTQTGGRGVDLVLNSLNGEFIERSVAVLADAGCFLELGKRGIWDEQRLRAVKPQASFHAFDLMDIARAEPRRILHLLEAVLARVASGELQSLPVTVFSLEQAPAAFRYMAQGKHVGKVVLSRRTFPRRDAPLARPDRSYLVTGGSGALGLSVARWLVHAGAGELVLMSRGAPSQRAEQTASELRALGSRVSFVAGDVARTDDVRALLDQLTTGERPLAGVIHAAGLLDDGVVTEQTRDRLERVLSPKLRGAWNLHKHTRGLELDFFVLFSSIAGVLGGAGQLNYAAANAALDGLAHYRRARGLAATSIAWGPWAGEGMAAGLDLERLSQRGLRPLPPDAALQALERALQNGLAQACVLDADWSRHAQHFGAGEPGLLSELATAPGATHAPPDPEGPRPSELLERLQAALPAQRMDLLVEHLQRLARSVLGYAEGDLVRRDQPLVEQGFDSLMAVEMRNRVSQGVARRLPASVLFDHPTLERLAQHLLGEVLTLGNERARVSPAGPAGPAQPASVGTPAASDVVNRLTRLLKG